MTTAQVVETSLSPTVLFRTTLTRTITLDNLLILLGSNHLLGVNTATPFNKEIYPLQLTLTSWVIFKAEPTRLLETGYARVGGGGGGRG